MSVVGDWIDQMYDDGFNKGMEQGIEQGIEQGFEEGTRQERNQNICVHVTMLMKNMNWTEEKACQALSIAKEEYQAAKAEMQIKTNGDACNIPC